MSDTPDPWVVGRTCYTCNIRKLDMELSCSLANAITRPRFILDHGNFRPGLSDSSLNPHWDCSCLNPKNRPDSLDNTKSRWRIDGMTACGTCFYAVPMDVPNVVPLQIFIFLCDQTQYPPALRSCLDAAFAVPLRHEGAISRLGVSKHICKALDHYCAQNPKFLDRHQKLPLGSRLVFDNVASNVRDMRLRIVAGYEVEQNAKTVEALECAWDHGHPSSPLSWLPQVNIHTLRLIRQLHDTVSIVQLTVSANDHPVNIEGWVESQTLIFKSVSDSSFEHLYHELRFLLTIPPHPNLMPRPVALVTKRQAFGGRQIIAGFLLKRLPLGSIRDILPTYTRSGTLSNRIKLQWCQQVTSALLHISEQADTFFSDLRPDNILLDCEGDSIDPLKGNIVLCDFEQRGNWYEWSAPEVLYRQYVENLRSTSPEEKALVNSPCGELLERYANAPDNLNAICQAASDMQIHARNRAWFCLSRQSSEKAMVYSLGLLIYTIFEGMPNISCNIANKWPIDPHLRIPNFKHCPQPVIDIVKRCSPEAWSGLPHSPFGLGEVVRVGASLCTRQMDDIASNGCEAANMVLDAALEWWDSQLSHALAFTETEDWGSGDFGRNRPTLKEVENELESLSDVMQDII